jgi:putative transposase
MSGVKFGKTGVPSHVRYIYARIRGSKGVMPVISSLRKFDESDIAKERMRIISFYGTYGEKATREAFGTNRKTISVWKKRIKSGNNHLVSLTPTSTRPKTVRSMLVDPRLIVFIRTLREQYPRRSKEKLKPFVDEEAKRLNIPTIATSTIGKVIKRNNLFFAGKAKIYHDPASKRGQMKRKKYIRVKRAPNPDLFGYLEMDTITKIVNGIKFYLYTAVDVRMKFSFAYPYTRLNSQNTVDFFKKLQLVFPVPIREVQTDNGLEFLGDFDNYLINHRIRHNFIYPRCPRINGVIERFNRTIQEDFLEFNLYYLFTPNDFCVKLADWLVYYNCYRVHQTLGLVSPMDYLVTYGGMSKKSVSCTII